MLEFNVKNQIISRTDNFDVVADSQNYLSAEFTFTEEWTGSVVAVFGGADGKFYDVLVAENKCLVPWEVIKAPFFTVSVFCGDLITANIVRVDGYTGAYGAGNNVMVGMTIISAVNVNRYICCDCGFTEEWIDKSDLETVKKIKKAKRIL